MVAPDMENVTTTLVQAVKNATVFVLEKEFRVCEPGGSGVVLPLIADENTWPEGLRVILYGVAMVYFFMGVAIIADNFVAAIEAVTARRQRTEIRATDRLSPRASELPPRNVTEKVWNETVATLSLLALGSSAPEIALSVVDLFKKDFHFTPLGAQTIVGSAAFNLLVIISVCICVIPSGETRKIAELPAFHVTAVVSLFAYVWLVFILIMQSPDIVELWEALLTLSFFPGLIWFAYKVDRGDVKGWFVSLKMLTHDSDIEVTPRAHSYIGFSAETYRVQPTSEGQQLEILVQLTKGVDECVIVNYRTEHFSAVPGYDYEELEGTLEFEFGEMEKRITLDIAGRSMYKNTVDLFLILDDLEGPVEFDPETDGGDESAICMVTLLELPSRKDNCKDSMSKIVDWACNIDSVRRGNADWKDQFTSAFFVNGSLEEQAEATKIDWVFHLLSMPWKVLFSLVPPTSYCGGWVCFYVSLAFIGVVTVFISDLAELFGCVLGVPDDITAISFVALGTSMPDLFASLSAAKEEPTADASIVNVTGSNSVNVFLGLGLPWTIGAVYWAVVGRTDEWVAQYPQFAEELSGAAFIVESRNLGFCVMVFSAACMVALGILHLRRKFLGAELGGPYIPKVASSGAFFLMWLGFVGVVSWRVLRWDKADMIEQGAVILGIGGLECCVASAAVFSLFWYRQKVRNSMPDASTEIQDPKERRRTASLDKDAAGASLKGQQELVPAGTKKESSKQSNSSVLSEESVGSLSEGVPGKAGVAIRKHVLQPRFGSPTNLRAVSPPRDNAA